MSRYFVQGKEKEVDEKDFCSLRLKCGRFPEDCSGLNNDIAPHPFKPCARYRSSIGRKGNYKRKCRRCSKSFKTTLKYQAICNKCNKTKEPFIEIERTCQTCGEKYTSKACRQLHCYDCRTRKEEEAEKRREKLRKPVICPLCKKSFVRSKKSQLRCSDCIKKIFFKPKTKRKPKETKALNGNPAKPRRIYRIVMSRNRRGLEAERYIRLSKDYWNDFPAGSKVLVSPVVFDEEKEFRKFGQKLERKFVKELKAGFLSEEEKEPAWFFIRQNIFPFVPLLIWKIVSIGLAEDYNSFQFFLLSSALDVLLVLIFVLPALQKSMKGFNVEARNRLRKLLKIK